MRARAHRVQSAQVMRRLSIPVAESPRSTHAAESFETIDPAALDAVAGGAADSSAVAMMTMMMMSQMNAPAAAAPAAAPQPVACNCGSGGGGGGFDIGSLLGGIMKMGGGMGGGGMRGGGMGGMGMG